MWSPGNGNAQKSFANGDTVTFNTLGSERNIDVSGTVEPGTLTISSGVNYSFTPLTGGSIKARGAINIDGVLTLYAAPDINTSDLPLLSTTAANNNVLTVNNGGSLILAGMGNHLGESTNIHLSEGRLAFTAGGASETLGALTLTGASSLDFAGGGSSLTFTSISGAGILNVFNFDPGDRLYLAQPSAATINFYSGSDINSSQVSYTAEVVPEPSTILAGLGLIGFLGWRERRRIPFLLKHGGRGEALSAR